MKPHFLTLEPEHYWACEQPERPVEVMLTHFDAECPACMRVYDVIEPMLPEDWLPAYDIELDDCTIVLDADAP